MLPFARELLRHGTQVVIAANSAPAINDITAAELDALLPQASAHGRLVHSSPGCPARSSASFCKTHWDDSQTRWTSCRCVRCKGAPARHVPGAGLPLPLLPPPTDCCSGPSPQVAAADPLLCKGISSRQLQVVASGSGLPVIDLSQVSVSHGCSAGGESWQKAGGAGGGWALRCSCFLTASCWAGVCLRDCKCRLCACVVLTASFPNPSQPATPIAPHPLDLQISSELAAAAEGADLVVLEGMGRSIETNLHARMRCGRHNMPGSRGGVVAGCLPPPGGLQGRRLAANHHTDACCPERHTTLSRYLSSHCNLRCARLPCRSCDQLNVGMIKHPEVAAALGGRLYDCVCQFRRSSTDA